MFLMPCGLFRYLFRYTCNGYQLSTLEMRRRPFQVNFWKDFWDCHWRQGKNWPIAGQHISNNNPRSLWKSKLSQGSFPHPKWQMRLALSILLNTQYPQPNSPHWYSYISSEISWEGLITDQSIFSLVIIWLILVTISLDNVWILLKENWWLSLLGLTGLSTVSNVMNFEKLFG